MPGKLLDIGSTQNVLVVSDVHMRTPSDERTKCFVEFLERVGTGFKCDTLILLGDIFDFFNARQRFYFELWKDVLLRLRGLKEKGVRVYFVEGNHDYGFEHSPYWEIKDCFTACGDMILRARHSKLGDTILLHSDDVVCPPSYRWFRSVVKSNLFQSILSPVPGSVTAALFSRYAGISRAKDDYRPLDPIFLTQCVEQFVKHMSTAHEIRPKVCVFGHIHVHLDDTFSETRFLSGPAWFTSPNLLSLTEAGQIEREWLRAPNSTTDLFTFTRSHQVSPQKSEL